MGFKTPFARQESQQYSDGDCAIYAQNIHDMMTTNVVLYPTPSPTMLVFQGNIDDYVTKLAAAVDGSKAQTAAKVAARAVIAQDILNLSLYANTEQYGNRANLLLSGIQVSIDPTPVGDLPAPTWRKCQSRNVGQLYVFIDALPSHPLYAFYYKKVADTVWQIHYSTARSSTIQELDSASTYEVKPLAIGTASTQNFGDTLVKVIL